MDIDKSIQKIESKNSHRDEIKDLTTKGQDIMFIEEEKSPLNWNLSLTP